MAKYADNGVRNGFDQAEAAFRRALELNPDLPTAHKLYAQLEADLGRARDAMKRLLERAKSADPELLAGLVSTCRYCGLLDASVAAHTRAVALEPRIRTSVPHTWFVQADHTRVATIKIAEYPYIVALSLAATGRADEALPALRELEETMRTRVPGFVIAARTLLEGNTASSLAAVNRIVASGFKDPEGLFYLTRHLAHLNEVGPALDLLGKVIAGGFFCFPTFASDPWLQPLRQRPAFTKLLRQAEGQHLEAAAAFTELGADGVLGVAPQM
jgi:tetratricopeptide (TPR) repeat protein